MLYDSFQSKRVEETGIVGIPNPLKERQLGGHCISIYGYSDKNQWFICMNSWGCYDSNTEVLTINGFKFFKDLKEDEEFATLDLQGKLAMIVSSKSDAIGYMYRTKDNKNILSFKTKDEVVCGSRANHLKNAEIVISELDEDGKFITHWDEIYTQLNK